MGSEPYCLPRNAESFLVLVEVWESYMRSYGFDQIQRHVDIFYRSRHLGSCVAPMGSPRHMMDVTPGYVRVMSPVLVGTLPARVTAYHDMSRAA